MVELDHSYSNDKPIEHNWETILDLEKLISCVDGGKVTEATGPESVKAEIKIKMGAMSMTFKGTVAVIEQDADAHRAVLQVKSREAGGQGHANADVTFTLSDGGAQLHTAAQITGKAASMGEGVVQNVLDALIKDFTSKLAAL
jgi:carbon monoxide dehydrogenase subunit G